MADPLDPVEALRQRLLRIISDGEDESTSAYVILGRVEAALAALPAPEEGTGWWCTEDCACTCGDEPAAAPVPEGVPEEGVVWLDGQRWAVGMAPPMGRPSVQAWLVLSDTPHEEGAP